MLTSRRYTVTPFDENGNSSLAAAAVQTTSGLAALTNVTATDGIGRIDVLAIAIADAAQARETLSWSATADQDGGVLTGLASSGVVSVAALEIDANRPFGYGGDPHHHPFLERQR